MVSSLVSGGLGGVLSSSMLQPFDVVRTQMQKGVEGCGHLTTKKAFKFVIKEGGIRSLWRGLTPTIARVGFGTAMYFSLLNAISEALTKVESRSDAFAVSYSSLSCSKAFAAGFLARTVASISLLPLTVVKTRFEAGENRHGGVLRSLVRIAQTESLPGLWKGLVPTLLRDAPFSGLYLASYTRLKSAFASSEALAPVPIQVQRFGAAVCAGSFASLLTNPFDVVRTRMQVEGGAGGGGSVQVAKSIIDREGWRALWLRGLMPRVYKKSFAAAVSWTVYEEGVKAISTLWDTKANLS